MSTKRMKARVGVALLGIGAVTAASVLPGALAVADETTSEVHTAVTRAVLSQGDTNGEISRSTLITQMQVDGSGQTSFSVPAPDGATPSDMDAFGGPTVEDGSAQYNLDVDGAQTLRTSQTYDPDELPVTVAVSATLDGQPIDPSDLAGQDGLATLTYTLNNSTSEPTEITYKNASGKPVTKTEEIPTPMAGSLSFTFDESWIEVTSAESDTVAQNGSGGTQVSATVALMSPPAGEPEATVTIEGRVENAVVPPADIKVAVIDPLATGAGRSGEALAKTTGEGLQTLYEGMELLASPTEGLGFLASGLGEAVTGADQIANGVSDTLAPGVAELADGVANTLVPGVDELANGLGQADAGANEIAIGVADVLGPGIHELRIKASVDGHKSALGASHQLVDTVRAQDAYKTLLGTFDKVNDGMFEIQDTQRKLTKALGEPFDVIKMGPNGPDLSSATISGGLATIVFGIPGFVPGLTNPKCNKADPQPKAGTGEQCGLVQILDLLLGANKTESQQPADEALNVLNDYVPAACKEVIGDCMDTTDLSSFPGVTQILKLFTGALLTGYTGPMGKDFFGPGGALRGKSVSSIAGGTGNEIVVANDEIVNLTQGMTDRDLAQKILDQTDIIDFGTQEIDALMLPLGVFSQYLEQLIGTGKEADGTDSEHSSVRYALGQLRTGMVSAPSGWPAGCTTGAPGTVPDAYGCGMAAGLLADAITGATTGTPDVSATNVLNTLAIFATKTDKDPGHQIPPNHPLYPVSLQFGVCPGGDADAALIQAHCSVNEVLDILSAGIAGDKAKVPPAGNGNVSWGKIDPDCPVVSKTPWITPKDGNDDGTVPDSPNAAEVEKYGVTCAERALKQSLNRILLPSIGNGIQKETLGTIGSGEYTPNCDPTVTGTLTCALSVLDEGVNGKSATSLVNGTQTLSDGLVLLDAGGQLLGAGVGTLNDGTQLLAAGMPTLVDGTRQLADGLPAAEAGAQAAADGVTQQMMPGTNSAVETANETIAALEALSVKANSGANIPGGAAEGVDSNQGIYAFQFAGSGTAAESSTARFGLALLLLLAAGGLGLFLASRKSA